jgi:hypothetical protein
MCIGQSQVMLSRIETGPQTERLSRVSGLYPAAASNRG